jgi:hypothetical protein
MMRRIMILATAIFILDSFVLLNTYAQEQSPDLKEIKYAGISFLYSTEDFAEVEIKKVKKHPVMGEGPAEGESPEHYCFNMKDKRPLPALEQGPRYFFPTDSFICAYPLQDASVEDFTKAYPALYHSAGALRKLLSQHPGNLKRLEETTGRGIPDFPSNNASHSFVSKSQYLDFRTGSGILFLTQYSNEWLPNPVNNEELTLVYQGLTEDGRFYVAARLAVTHPDLPRGIDFTDDTERDRQFNYLKKEEKELDEFPEASFQPSLGSLKAMLSSLQIE